MITPIESYQKEFGQLFADRSPGSAAEVRSFNASFGNIVFGVHFLESSADSFGLQLSIDHYAGGPDGPLVSRIPVLDLQETYDQQTGAYVTETQLYPNAPGVPRTFFAEHSLIVPALLRREIAIREYLQKIKEQAAADV